FAPLIRPEGRVLDLAAGGGRPSPLLRAMGFRVVAVGRGISGLPRLAGDPACEVVALGLEGRAPGRLGGFYYGVVVPHHPSPRPLFPALSEALAPGGLLIYETFALGNERFGKPRNPDFLLRQGELLDAFAGLAVIAFEQGIVERPRPAAIQRIAAIKGDASGI